MNQPYFSRTKNNIVLKIEQNDEWTLRRLSIEIDSIKIILVMIHPSKSMLLSIRKLSKCAGRSVGRTSVDARDRRGVVLRQRQTNFRGEVAKNAESSSVPGLCVEGSWRSSLRPARLVCRATHVHRVRRGRANSLKPVHLIGARITRSR